jgi:hypothetical protein
VAIVEIHFGSNSAAVDERREGVKVGEEDDCLDQFGEGPSTFFGEVKKVFFFKDPGAVGHDFVDGVECYEFGGSVGEAEEPVWVAALIEEFTFLEFH